jgi:hypothetical protein
MRNISKQSLITEIEDDGDNEINLKLNHISVWTALLLTFFNVQLVKGNNSLLFLLHPSLLSGYRNEFSF